MKLKPFDEDEKQKDGEEEEKENLPKGV